MSEEKQLMIIAKQQLEIERLKERVQSAKDAFENINRAIFCIGGPLNDSTLGYTDKQLIVFSKIGELIADVDIPLYQNDPMAD